MTLGRYIARMMREGTSTSCLAAALDILKEVWAPGELLAIAECPSMTGDCGYGCTVRKFMTEDRDVIIRKRCY